MVGALFNYPAAEMRGGVDLTPPAVKMAARVTITLLYQSTEVSTLNI